MMQILSLIWILFKFQSNLTVDWDFSIHDHTCLSDPIKVNKDITHSKTCIQITREYKVFNSNFYFKSVITCQCNYTIFWWKNYNRNGFFILQPKHYCMRDIIIYDTVVPSV